MRLKQFGVLVLLSAGAVACRNGQVDPEKERRDSASGAYKAGEKAHMLANDAERAAEEARRKIREGAHEIREGWKDQGKADSKGRPVPPPER